MSQSQASSTMQAAMVGVFEFGLGLTLGSLLDSVAPPVDADKHWKAEAIESAAQIAGQVMVLQSTGEFIANRIVPDLTVAGFMLSLGLWAGQPNLHKKVKHVVANMKSGMRTLLTTEAAGAKEKPQDAPDPDDGAEHY